MIGRCQTGPSTMVYLEEQTERAGSMQLIFQRMFANIHYIASVQCNVISKLAQAVFVNNIICFVRSYHGHKTLKDFVRRRRWARYY